MGEYTYMKVTYKEYVEMKKEYSIKIVTASDKEAVIRIL